jgi:histidine ammonia-lyase
MRTVIVNGDALTVQDVIDVGRGDARAELGLDVPDRMDASLAVVTSALAGDAPVYGVNTGFGALADTSVGEQDLKRLQRAIIVSHAAGTGEPLDDAAVRAILLATPASARNSRGGCCSCSTSACSRSCPARGRSAPPATWPSWRTSRSR